MRNYTPFYDYAIICSANTSRQASAAINYVRKDTTDFDFEVDDEVMVHHVRKDGSEVFVDGVVIEVGHDDFGPYTRVRGDNGNHYRAGASLGLIRKGTRIIRKL
jgi:hypothetical protein